MTRSLGGDLDAYAQLVARYTVRAHRVAFLLGAGEDADDVVQESFVKAFRHLSRFRTSEAFAPWLLTIVANETRNLTRSRRRRADLTTRLSVVEAGRPVVEDGPVDHVIADERRDELLRAIAMLPEKERQAVVCRYLLELTEPETARMLRWPLGSVKSRTFRAMKRLRELLGREASDG